MYLSEIILVKKCWRSDFLWTKPLVYSTFLKRIALNFDTKALLKSQYWPHEELERIQVERIRTLLSHASRIPFWKEWFSKHAVDPACIMGLHDFKKIPVITRRDFLGKSWAEVTSEPDIARLNKTGKKDHTSGSTGFPLYFYVDRSFELRSFAICERLFLAAGGGKRFPIISIRARRKLGFPTGNAHLFHVRGFNSIKHRAHALKEFVVSFGKGYIFYGFSSYLAELARISNQEQLAFHPRAVIATGEQLIESDREYMQKIFGCPVFDTYATRELGQLTFECEYQVLHISSEWALLESVDERGNALPHGKEGRIIVTTFDNRIMPFIRYDTGDWGSIKPSSCECGRTLPVLSISGRGGEIIELRNGRRVAALDLVTAFDEYPGVAQRFQIIQTGPDNILIKIIPGAFWKDLKDALYEKMERNLHLYAKIDWEIVDDIPAEPSGKIALVKSLRQIHVQNHA
ncbi:MAG: hypothetical protein Q8Q41_02260 [bacterium]|nr:hypothetical protein [bacterium]